MDNNNLDIKKIRKDLGLNQEEFAKLVGISRHSVINYEKGAPISDAKMKYFRSIIDKINKGDSTDLHNVLSEPPSIYGSVKDKDLYIESLERIIQSKDEQIKALQDSIVILKSMLGKPKE